MSYNTCDEIGAGAWRGLWNSVMLRAMPDTLGAFLDRTWYGITGLEWLVAAAILVVLTPVLVVVRGVVAERLRAAAARTTSDMDDLFATLVGQSRGWFFALIGLRVATVTLDLMERWDHRVHTALIIGGMIQAGIWAGTLVRYVVDRRFARHVQGEGPASQVTPIAQTLLRFAGLVLVWSVVLLVVLSAFGIDITALVAGLGIGGIAIALAVQQVLGDIFASISIIVDKPFAPGEFIALGDISGTVRRIGIRSTVLSSLGGEELVLSNNDLLSSRIHNYTRMHERRVVFKVGVEYSTSDALLAGLSKLLRAAVERRESVRFDRATLINLGDSAIEYEVVYWVLSPGYDVYVAVHQELLLDLVREMRAAGYAFAFPSRSLYVVPPEPPAEAAPGSAD